MVRLMWRITAPGGYLVLADVGNPIGSHAIRSARALLLEEHGARGKAVEPGELRVRPHVAGPRRLGVRGGRRLGWDAGSERVTGGLVEVVEPDKWRPPMRELCPPAELFGMLGEVTECGAYGTIC